MTTLALIIFAAGACTAVDGDTLKCGEDKIRLARIDAPELSEPKGPQARDFLVRMMTGKEVQCAVSDRREKHGRLLGDCFAGPGLSMSDIQLRVGNAEPYRK